MPRYTTAEELARYLGRDFSDDESAVADMCIEAAEVIVDRKTGLTYKQSGSQVFSVFNPPSPFILLPGNGPFSSISLIGYSNFGSAGAALQLGSHYEIRDANKGVIWLLNPDSWHRIDVTYTPTNDAPGNVKLATNMLAAHWMRPILNDEIPGLANYSVGAEFSVAFSQFVQASGYPAEVDILLGVPALYIA